MKKKTRRATEEIWEDLCQDCGAVYDIISGKGLCRPCWSEQRTSEQESDDLNRSRRRSSR